MMSYWLNKVLGSDQTENLGKLVPLIVFFVIWVLGAIAKAAKKGKQGTEAESEASDEGHQEPGFDDLAKKIRERYAQAREQAMKNIENRQGGNEQSQPPARPVVKSGSIPVPSSSIAPTGYQAGPKSPGFEGSKSQEGPTLKVVRGLERPAVNVPITVDKPTLDKVEPGLQRVEGITSDVPMVSTETGTKQSHYLSKLAAQYSTVDGFREAILNYEILGPPLALRE